MKRLRSTLIAGLIAASTVVVGGGVADAASTTCNSGSSLGNTFYNPGGGAATINESTAWRFRSLRNNAGEFYVGAFSGDNASGIISQNTSSLAGTWVGRWGSNYAQLANSIKVTNYGGSGTFTYDRSCTPV